DQFAAQFAELSRGVEIAFGEHASAEPIAGFVERNGASRFRETIRDRQPGRAAADNSDAFTGASRAVTRRKCGAHHQKTTPRERTRAGREAGFFKRALQSAE